MRIRKQWPVDEALIDDEINAAAKIADALAHPARIRMLRFILAANLARQIVTNKDLVKAFDYAQATVSQHLSKLIIGGLLDVQKRKTSSCYFVRIGRISAFIDILKKIDFQKDEGGIPFFLQNDAFTKEAFSGGLGGDLSLAFFDDDNDETPLDL